MARNPYISQVDQMVERADIEMQWSSIDDAKRYIANIRQLKQEIALVKREITAAKRQIHAQAASQRTQVGKGFAGGAARGIFGAKNAGRANAAAKDHLRKQELNAIAPLTEAETHIAQVLAGLDKLKLSMESWLAQQKR